jgi:hypothetical protein
MRNIQIVVMGGCHVVGYPVSQSNSFPTLLCELVDGEIIKQVPNLQFLHVAKHLAFIEEAQCSHVVLQLGNYAFSASFYHVLRQFKRAFDLPINTTYNGEGSRSGSSNSGSSDSNSALHGNTVAALPAKGWLDAYLRVIGLGAITTTTWLFSSKHRQVFQALNKCMVENPNISFFFLSPLPCLDPPANALRRLGSWLLRRGLHKLPNCHWLDSHKVVATTSRYFADPSHLSRIGHEALATQLAGAFEQHKKPSYQTENYANHSTSQLITG